MDIDRFRRVSRVFSALPLLGNLNLEDSEIDELLLDWGEIHEEDWLEASLAAEDEVDVLFYKAQYDQTYREPIRRKLGARNTLVLARLGPLLFQIPGFEALPFGALKNGDVERHLPTHLVKIWSEISSDLVLFHCFIGRLLAQLVQPSSTPIPFLPEEESGCTDLIFFMPVVVKRWDDWTTSDEWLLQIDHALLHKIILRSLNKPRKLVADQAPLSDEAKDFGMILYSGVEGMFKQADRKQDALLELLRRHQCTFTRHLLGNVVWADLHPETVRHLSAWDKVFETEPKDDYSTDLVNLRKAIESELKAKLIQPFCECLRNTGTWEFPIGDPVLYVGRECTLGMKAIVNLLTNSEAMQKGGGELNRLRGERGLSSERLTKIHKNTLSLDQLNQAAHPGSKIDAHRAIGLATQVSQLLVLIGVCRPKVLPFKG